MDLGSHNVEMSFYTTGPQPHRGRYVFEPANRDSWQDLDEAVCMRVEHPNTVGCCAPARMAVEAER